MAEKTRAKKATMRSWVPESLGAIHTIRIIRCDDEPLEVQGDEWCRDEFGDMNVYVNGEKVLTVRRKSVLVVQREPG